MDSKREQRKRPRPGFAFWAILALIGWMAVSQLARLYEFPPLVSYSQFQVQLNRKNIASVQLRPESRELQGQFRQPAPVDGHDLTRFRVILPYSDPTPLISQLQSQGGIEIEAEPSNSGWLGLLASFIPWVLIGAFWYFALRRMRGGGIEALSFGKARTGQISPETPKITFADVADVEEAKTELQEIVAFLKSPDRFQRLGGHLPKGVLLVGAPGTGKTLLARATAGEAGRPVLTISGSDFVELFVGVGAARVRDLFAQARTHAPCIVFIDELDAVGRTRGLSTMGGTHEEREQTLNQLLVELDGFEPSEGIIVLAATNRPDVLDPALLRPGRFDRRIVVDLPDVRGREQILRIHARKVPVAPSVDLAAVARGSPGLSGADLANLVNEAALLAARRQKVQVDQQDFEEAKDKVILGIERRSLVLTDTERRITACHEAGHALVNLMLPALDPVQKVTIVPRGRALGLTYATPMEDRHNYTREYLLARLTMAQGGRIAEELVFGPHKVTTGAAQDFAESTELARQMVLHFGMSERLGPIGVGERTPELPFSAEPARRYELSEQTAALADREIRRLLEEAAGRARTILSANYSTLQLMAAELLEHETLDRPALQKLLDHKELPPTDRTAPAPLTGPGAQPAETTGVRLAG